jgi:hypothetical protein
MQEETTTDAPVETGGSIQGVQVNDQGQPQPEQTEQAEAVAISTEPETQVQTEEEPSIDNSATDWLKNKGIDPNSPEALEKVASMYRESEKALHKKAQQASQLEKSVKVTDEEIPLEATQSQLDSVRVRNLELRQELIDWRQNNPDKRELETKMTGLLNEDPNLKALVREGYLNFDKLYAMAKGLDGGHDDAVKSQAKRETLERLAQKQQAAVPTGNAVNPSGTGSESITSQNVDRLVGQNSLEWFQANRDAINRAMAG